MKIKRYFINYAVLFSMLFAVASSAAAQKPVQPRQEKLLNGLKLLMWNDAGSDKVTVKLRIHSGAAFDTANKEGTMALLADALFPNETVKEFFRDDLDGNLDVTSNFDYIQINATGNADQILTVLETVAAAVTKPQIDKDTTAKIRAARLEKIKELEKNPAYVADLLAAKQLFGNYPYGKASEGTAESLAKIDFADLLLAKQRFFTADNATVAVSGNIKYDYVFKAVRQLFGGWEKSDKRVPATFAQPDAPPIKSFVNQTETENVGELRFAFRSLARNDKDFAAAEILTKILNGRLQAKEGNKAAIYQNTRLLSGYVILKISDWNVGQIKVEGDNVALPGNFSETVVNLLKPDVTADEFAKAKAEMVAERGRQNTPDAWLDADTYKLVSVKDDLQKASDATLADVQRVAAIWKKETAVPTLLITKSK